MMLAGQIFRFGCVGAVAAAVHLAVVAALVPAGLTPPAANVAGFALAFHASYHGHRGWTFRSSGGPREYLGMLAVASLAFAANQALYLCLLRFTPLDYRLSLAIVLVTVAAGTFGATRAWVFRPPVHPSCGGGSEG